MWAIIQVGTLLHSHCMQPLSAVRISFVSVHEFFELSPLKSSNALDFPTESRLHRVIALSLEMARIYVHFACMVLHLLEKNVFSKNVFSTCVYLY